MTDSYPATSSEVDETVAHHPLEPQPQSSIPPSELETESGVVRAFPQSTLIRIPIDTKGLQVIKRDHRVISYNPEKIAQAIAKALFYVDDTRADVSETVRQRVERLTLDITNALGKRLEPGATVHIEDIQDQVELALMREGLHQVAREYVIYRSTRQAEREQAEQRQDDEEAIWILDHSGLKQRYPLTNLRRKIETAMEEFPRLNVQAVFDDAMRGIYEGMRLADVDEVLMLAARQRMDEDPDYASVCARLLRSTLIRKVSDHLIDIRALSATELQKQDDENYPEIFKTGLSVGVKAELLDPALLEFDLEKLAQALQPQRDMQFKYIGLQTLCDRYFLHIDDRHLELPQCFFMRVAMGLAVNETQKNERAIEFYDLLSSFDFMSSTPTLFNSGTLRPQLSSCYLTTINDDLDDIFGALKDNANLSKWAGGLGNDWTPVRALGSRIKGTNGKSQGVIPFLKVANDTAVAVNQGGKRKGAVCAYLECWHLDVEEFLELRKNTGEERRRTHDMNSANWIPDLFMKRVIADENWTLFSPSDAPDLHDLVGRAFEKRYQHYEQQVENGEISLYRQIRAQDLWRKMLSMLFETGHPWITFKDPCNLRSPQGHIGRVHSSNLCTEITLNTSADEIAVCNLGSVNLVNHLVDGELDAEHLKRSVDTAVRILDNVIDINFYPVPQAKNSNLKHRPIGLGLMGFQDALYARKIAYDSTDAVHFADQSMELLSYFALQASSNLAAERGRYDSYDGSLWDQGVLPIDSIRLLGEERGEEYLTMDSQAQIDWQPLRDLIAKQGMRNSNVLAIAPTATIANIVGVSQSIEPTYQNLYVKSNLSGEFLVVNHWLVDELRSRNLWDAMMVNDLKHSDGSVANIARIPDDLKKIYATAFELDSRWLIEAAARRQKWIDQAQSLNLYMAEPSGLKLDSIYKLAWSRGLKTTYYLRSLGATQTEKLSETSDDLEQQAGPDLEPEPKVCSILDPDCEACQ